MSSSNNLDHSYSVQSGTIRPNEPSPDYLWKFDNVICDFLKEQGIPGATFYMTYRERPVYQQGYGINKYGVPMSSSSHLRIASISKVFTAIAILRLCEEKRLTLHQKVFGDEGILKSLKLSNNKHVKISHGKGINSITIRHLLEHSAGWDRDLEGDHVFWYADDKHAGNFDINDDEQFILYVLSQGLTFTPGSKHVYSNFGYLILGLVVEKITDMNYEDYVKIILQEIGIEDIYVGKSTQYKANFMEAKYYNNGDVRVKKSFDEPTRNVEPQYGSFPMETTGSYGGWVTCAKSLVTILDNLCNNNDDLCLLTKRWRKEMFKAPKFANDEAWYGLGIDVQDNGASFGHTGAMEGTTTTVYHSMNGFTWALLLNAWAKDTDLDGMIKYALYVVQFSFTEIDSNRVLIDCDKNVDVVGTGDNFLVSQDKVECVQILLPYDTLLSHIDIMKRKGYLIHNISVVSVAKEIMFNIVWTKPEDMCVDWFVELGIDIKEINEIIAINKNYRIRNMICYIYNDNVKYLFVIERSKSFTLDQHCVLTSDLEIQSVYSDFNALGYEIKYGCVQYRLTERLILLVFEKMHDNSSQQTIFLHNISMETFPELMAQKVEQGFYLEDFHVYATADGPHFCGVWKKGDIAYNLENNVYLRHGVSRYGFLFEMQESLADNLPVKFVEAYMEEDVINFATVWNTEPRETANRISCFPRTQFQNNGISEFQKSLYNAFINTFKDQSPLDSKSDNKSTTEGDWKVAKRCRKRKKRKKQKLFKIDAKLRE
ncbi:hypothetical protein ACF0H5_007329 [Mactra antiquata]